MTAFRADPVPEATVRPLIRVWIGDEEPRPRARIIDGRPARTGAEEVVTGHAPIRAAVARWLAN